MKTITETLEHLALQWSAPRVPSCQVAEPLESQVPLKCEVLRRKTPIAIHGDFPGDLVEMWSAFEESFLFFDSRKTIWGLHLLSHEASANATKAFSQEAYTQFIPGDVIIGEFLGDLDRLLVRCDSKTPDYGHIIAVLPDGLRCEWFQIADSLFDFMSNYEKLEGEKFWERASQN